MTSTRATRWDFVALAIGAVALAAFELTLVQGIPPSVDLPTHAAQIMLAARYLAGLEPEVSVYTLDLASGYGLSYALLAPLAWATDGWVAARAGLVFYVAAFPLGLGALLHAYGRPAWWALLAAPMAYGASYWYGFLPFLFGVPILFAAAALHARALAGSRRAWLGVAAAAAALFLAHLLLFVFWGALALAQWAAAPERRRGLALTALAHIPALALAMTSVVHHLQSDLTSSGFELGPPRLRWTWFLKNYGSLEGPGSVSVPLAAAALAIGLGAYARLRHRPDAPPAGAWALFGAAAIAGLACPYRTASATLLFVRFPAIIGALAFVLLPRELPKRLVAVLAALALAGMAGASRAHVRFAHTEGDIDAVSRQCTAPAARAALVYGPSQVPGSRLPYRSNLGNLCAARAGGVDANLFVGMDHIPLRARTAPPAPATGALESASLAPFEELVVLGDPSPRDRAALAPWTVVSRTGKASLLRRPEAAAR